ncbi:MAG: protein kinase [Deltaproteobacteria bacterium]|nr:protein kinase [Deltaproteobacteria bacterium]
MKLEGTTLGGKYRIVRQVGAGGMGRVFEAVHEQTERTVAVKVLSPEAAQQPDTLVRFDREARAAGRIGHDNICEVIDVGFADGNIPYLVMPMLRGQALSTALRAAGPMPLKRCLDVATQILAALAAAHDAGVIHRDLKPDNVFLVRMGDREDFVKVLDFGISKMLHETRPDATLTQTGTILGTPYYMSPEQARGLKDLDARVDVYATGAILYQLLTGKPPFDGDSYNQLLSAILLDDFPKPSVLRPETPPAVEAVILRATQKDRQLRYRDAADMRRALLAAVTGTSLKPADLLASSETLPAVSDAPPAFADPSLAPTSATPSSPFGPSAAPALRTPSPLAASTGGSGAPGAVGAPPASTPAPAAARTDTGGQLAGAGDASVSSALSQSRMGQAVLAETAARPPRSRLVGAAVAVAALAAIVALAVLLVRLGAERADRGDEPESRPAVGVADDDASSAPRVGSAQGPTTLVAPVPVPLVVPTPAAPDADTPDVAAAPAVGPAVEVVEPPSEVRIVLRGVPRGARVLVDGEGHKGTTVLRRRGSGEVRIEVQERGFRPWQKTVPLDEDREIEVRLEPTGPRPPRDGGAARDGGGLPVWAEDG